MEEEIIIIVSVLSAAWALLLILVMVAFCFISKLKRQIADLQGLGRVRVQKLSISNDKNHAFHNPVISPDEELSRRGYSMYVAEDVEGGRTNERQTGGQFVEELTRELETRQHQQQQNQKEHDLQNQQDQQRNQQQRQTNQQENRNGGPPPPFLLQAIEENKRKSRSITNAKPVANANPMANANPLANKEFNSSPKGRSSETNPNFIY